MSYSQWELYLLLSNWFIFFFLSSFFRYILQIDWINTMRVFCMFLTVTGCSSTYNLFLFLLASYPVFPRLLQSFRVCKKNEPFRAVFIGSLSKTLCHGFVLTHFFLFKTWLINSSCDCGLIWTCPVPCQYSRLIGSFCGERYPMKRRVIHWCLCGFTNPTPASLSACTSGHATHPLTHVHSR